MDDISLNNRQGLRLIIPVGTQVVTRVEKRDAHNELVCLKGAVGVIIKAPVDQTHSYRVRFPDGWEGSFTRQEVVIRKQFQAGDVMGEEPQEKKELYDHIIYRCVVGSRAYGLDNENSDTDRRGIYLPPTDLTWSLNGVPEQLESKDTEECYWEIEKFLTLALKANPNILECLYTPLIETATSLAEELLALRGIFLSQIVYQTYNGYVMSQFKKLEQDLRTKGNFKWKHAMHLIRLLLAGVTIMKEEIVPVRVEMAQKTELLAIRRGEVPWEEVNQRRLQLHEEFARAFAATKLPERPDYEKANEFLIKARRSMI